MSLASYVILLLAGSVGGLMAGLLGVGGGIIFVPIITYVVEQWLPQSPHFTAIVMANSFMVILALGLRASVKQRQLGMYYPRIVLATGLSAILIALITSRFFVSSGAYSKRMFTLLFMGLLLFILYRFLRQAWIEKVRVNKGGAIRAERSSASYPLRSFVVPGLLSGLAASLSGLGGGIIMIPYFTQVLRIPIQTATGLSLSIITLSAFPLVVFYLLQAPEALTTSHVHTGYILWELSLPLMLGALIGVGPGINLSKKTGPIIIYLLLSLFVIITFTKMLLSL